MLLVSTSSFRGYGLHKIFKIVKKAGYDGINIDMISGFDIISGSFDSENAEYIKELSQEFNIPVVSISAYEKRMDSKLVDEIIDMANIIGVKIINFYPPHRADKDTTWFASYLSKAKEKAKDISLSIINVVPKTFLFFIPEYKDATLSTIKKITGSTSLAISNVDPSTGVDLLKTFSMLGNTIKNVFLSDRIGTKQDLQLGKGEMPLRDLLGKLKENGYNGLFTLRLSPKELGVGHEETILKRMGEARAYLEKYFKI